MSRAASDWDAIAGPAARVVDRLGTAEFYDSLLDLLGTVAPHDLAAMVRYSRAAPPDLILPQVEPSEPIRSYHQDFFALDPFYLHWRNGGDVGVFRLRDMDAHIGRSRYAREFLRLMTIHDEVAVFLPPLGDASPTLILDRARGTFTPTEVERVRRLFPLVAALHRRHLGIFVASGIDAGMSPFGQERPLRLLDRGDRQVFATQAWSAVIAQASVELTDALEIVVSRGPCAVPLGAGRFLRRTQLPPDFGPAPDGFCDEIITDTAPLGPSPPTSLPAALAMHLTARECEVVVLTLRGHPVIEVARRLGLSRGTVKNHRLSIYRKLDITTERELFGEYLAAIRDQRAVQAPDLGP